MLHGLALGPDAADVSMETLASVWACDLSERQHEPVWESGGDSDGSRPAGVTRTEQLSPHLQRNRQLQDTLLQREEELARLQEENNKLREFLSSSFVRDLEKKAKELTADGRMKLKRNLMYVGDGPSQNCGGPEQVSKRLCRSLAAEFCSEDTSASSEPNLDFWVLRVLGLKDRDTIDTASESLSSFGSSLRSLVYETAVVSSSEQTPNFMSSTPSSAHNYCQHAAQMEQRYSADCQTAKSPETCAAPADQPSDVGAVSLNDAATGSYDALTAFQSRPLTEKLSFARSPDRADICSITALSEVLPFQGSHEERSAYRSPQQGPSQDTSQFSPPGQTGHLSSTSTLRPVTNAPRRPIRGCSATSTSTRCQPPAAPHRTDLAFSMSLSPSSSVRTHSFPQGQAFVRKDGEGRWNFTWVPTQGPW